MGEKEDLSAPLVMGSLRKRSPPTAVTLPSSGPEVATTPTRPSLARSSTNSTSAGEATPSLSEYDSFEDSGNTFLELLVVLDAHLELWSRGLRKTSYKWRERADALVDDTLSRAQKLQEKAIKLPRLKSEAFLSGMLEDSVLSAKDREKMLEKYKEVRVMTRESLKKISQKWEEE